jgi:hypothetical protein
MALALPKKPLEVLCLNLRPKVAVVAKQLLHLLQLLDHEILLSLKKLGSKKLFLSV